MAQSKFSVRYFTVVALLVSPFGAAGARALAETAQIKSLRLCQMLQLTAERARVGKWLVIVILGGIASATFSVRSFDLRQ